MTSGSVIRLSTTVETHALVSCDLSRYGAIKTMNYRSLCRPGALHTDDVVLFAGGGTIGAKWTDMHSNLLGATGNRALYYLGRLLGEAKANEVSRIFFGGKAPFPWVAGPEDFSVPVRVAYNAVGGSEFAHHSPLTQSRILERLGKATYLSVRSAETKRLLSAVEETVAVNLAPDSAILMSEHFPLPQLESKVSESLREIIECGPYVCFQSHVRYARRNEDSIVAALGNIYETYGLRALLLPIGRYVGLDDQIALQNILQRMRTPARIVSDEASIWEIMFTIARASLFLGTSLHGNVTSQSFAVPHLGLIAPQPNKLDHYLATWDLPEQARCVALDEVNRFAGRVLAVPELARREKRSELIELAHANFEKMASACRIEWQGSRPVPPDRPGHEVARQRSASTTDRVPAAQPSCGGQTIDRQ